ncbi:hypothetical protein Pan44_15300 [Caulifigura coniformis]|uniref:Tim44-like domain protein n=1 Tax=Caulifigura coniformis TaxID=2527983 RepID=A0A517SBL7_9PLAN|nr:hypothetical protein [Caulifigura coniformis]QDT53508.1 hypothetical protein Pan44_15300 [Caulifigura coniformis]
MWYGDTLWPTLVAIGSVAALAGVIWWDRRRPIFLMVALACIPAAIVAIVVEQRIVTPREQVTASLHNLIRDFEKQDSAAVTEAISGRSPELQRLAERAVEKVKIENIRVTDVNAEISGEDVLRARVHFRLSADVVYSGVARMARQPTRWMGSWEQEADGKWRLFEIDQLDPLTGEPTLQARQYIN